MLKSMTGFGQSNAAYFGKTIYVEARSLNSKFLDLSLRTIPLNSLQELWLRAELSTYIQRGKVSISIVIEDNDPLIGKSTRLDLDLLASYLESLEPLSSRYNQKPDQLLSACLSLPGLFKTTEEIPSDELWVKIQQAFTQSLKGLNQFREREGATIQSEIKLRTDKILLNLSQVEELAPSRIILIRSRMEEALETLKPGLSLDSNRLEQELIYYIDKIDFSEEISRLKTHLVFFLETLEEAESNGKKLGFITQEMGREINTMGSKANDALIQQKVVNMKEELEKIKEQMANIL